MHKIDSISIGMASGAVSLAVPDNLASDMHKILIGVTVALVTGSVHSAVKWLWGLLAHKKGGS